MTLTKMLAIRFPDKLHAQLKRAAKAQHRPLATYVRLLLQEEMWEWEFANPELTPKSTRTKELAR